MSQVQEEIKSVPAEEVAPTEPVQTEAEPVQPEESSQPATVTVEAETEVKDAPVV